LTLFTLIFTILYSLFYDYLYNGYGTMLLFLPVGISRVGVRYINDASNRDVQFSGPFPRWKQRNFQILFILIILMVVVISFNFNKVRSIWFSNLGAVQMSRVELMNFPTNQWADMEILPALETADASLHSALQYDPDNITANYRLGMIAMLRRDFNGAVKYLEMAYKRSPNHRGVIKTLSYCYVWLGEAGKAQVLLKKIPEAKNEMNVYSWWWGEHGQADLADKASVMASQLETASTNK
jgi:tetratricopeptide (TPR) repeat protein